MRWAQPSHIHIKIILFAELPLLPAKVVYYYDWVVTSVMI
jgi:hypothetical protein